MVVGINGYEAVVPRFGFDKAGLPNRVGTGEYAFQILNALHASNKNNKYFIYLPVEPSADLPSENPNWKYEVFKSKKLWTLLGLSKRLNSNKEKLDVFFSPTQYLPINFRVPSVVSVHDLSYIHYPELFNKKDLLMLIYWTQFSINRAKKIIAVSQSSKNDIINAYKVSEDKITVIYHGIKHESRIKNHELSMEDLKKKFGIEKNYILFVGTIQPRKNISSLIHAFSKIDSDLKLVIVGKKGWQYEEILASPKEYGVEDRVLFIHNAGDKDLPALYKNAGFFILPSLYEGFGLPVLEAMNYGTPVITSNVSSLPEVGGDAVLYVDPNDVEDISAKMKKLLGDEDLRKELVKKGHEQVKKFSWERSAKETLKVIENVVES